MDKLLQQRKDIEKKRAEIGEKFNALATNPDLTPEQVAEYEQFLTEDKKLKAQLSRIDASIAHQKDVASSCEVTELLSVESERASLVRQTSAERERRLLGTTRITTPDAPPARTHADDQGRVTGFWEETDETINFRVGESADAQRRQTYREAKRRNVRLLKSAGYQPWGEFKSFSDFVRAGFEGHERHAFQDRMNRHFAAVQGMNEGVGSEGGYTVMPEFAPGIIDRVYANDLWSRTDNYTVTGNNMTFLSNAETSRATGSRHGGLRGYWLGEGATVTASKPTLREVSLKLAKLGVVVYLTQELVDDGGFALQEYVTRKASEEFNFLIGDALVNGTGVGQPLGIGNAPSLVSVAKETGQQVATLQTENITKMFTRFYAGNRPNMVWLLNQDVESQLFTLSLGIGAAGVTTYMPPGGMSGSPYATLMGRPMLTTEFNATLGTQLDLIAADLGQILSISKGGIAQAVSMHIQFLTDQMALRFILRVNARPWENAPITPFKGTANTQSSFVTLDTRA